MFVYDDITINYPLVNVNKTLGFFFDTFVSVFSSIVILHKFAEWL